MDGIHSDHSQYRLVARAIELLRAQAGAQPRLAQLAQQLGVSPTHLQRVFSEWAGISPKRFLQFLTKESARELLRAQRDVLDTSLACGLSGAGRLHDLMVSCEAMTPGEIRAGAAGLRLQAGFARSSLGWVRAAATTRGWCALDFVAAPDATAWDELRSMWPQAEVVREDAPVAALVAQCIDRVVLQARPVHLSLHGTNFQLRVWQALLAMPPGQCLSYGELARRLDCPKAHRAVARAVGANPVAVLIPCHRVLRADGDLAGYRWGLARKAALLAREFADP